MWRLEFEYILLKICVFASWCNTCYIHTHYKWGTMVCMFPINIWKLCVYEDIELFPGDSEFKRSMVFPPSEVDSTASESTYTLALGRRLNSLDWLSGDIWTARYDAKAAAAGGSENVGDGLLIKEGSAKKGIILGRTSAEMETQSARQY